MHPNHQAPIRGSDLHDHRGIGPGAITLQESLCKAYRDHIIRAEDSDYERADGCTPPELVATFRNELREDIQIAIARGLATQINMAGRPAHEKWTHPARTRPSPATLATEPPSAQHVATDADTDGEEWSEGVAPHHSR